MKTWSLENLLADEQFIYKFSTELIIIQSYNGWYGWCLRTPKYQSIVNLLDIRTRNLKYILDKVISSSRIGPDDLIDAFFHRISINQF